MYSGKGKGTGWETKVSLPGGGRLKCERKVAAVVKAANAIMYSQDTDENQ